MTTFTQLVMGSSGFLYALDDNGHIWKIDAGANDAAWIFDAPTATWEKIRPLPPDVEVRPIR